MRAFKLTCAFVLSLLAAGCANDKTLHFVAGAAASKFTTQTTNSPMAGCAAALATGIAKEIYDRKFGGVVDRYDALATGAGCMYTVRF